MISYATRIPRIVALFDGQCAARGGVAVLAAVQQAAAPAQLARPAALQGEAPPLPLLEGIGEMRINLE